MTQPQGHPDYTARSPLPSHGKYFVAMVAVGIIALIIGGGVGFGLAPFKTQTVERTVKVIVPQFTLTHGAVDISPNSGTPEAIYFDNQYTGNLTAVISTVSGQSNSYQLYLPINQTYQVTIYYSTSLSAYQHCTARPSPFTASGSDYLQDFLCA